MPKELTDALGLARKRKSYAHLSEEEAFDNIWNLLCDIEPLLKTAITKLSEVTITEQYKS